MQRRFAKIAINSYENNLSLKLNLNGELTWLEEKMDHFKTTEDQFMLLWVLNFLKPIFFEMPLDKIDIVYSKDVFQKVGDILRVCANILKCTNDAIAKYAHLQGFAEQNKGILCIFNVDSGSRYKAFYDKLRSMEGMNISHMHVDWGYNPAIRKWEDTDIPLPLPSLIELVAKENIRKIVSLNHYFLEEYIGKVHTYLPALFRYIGVEYIIIDNDIYDASPTGYMWKAFFNCNHFNRFSLDANFHEYWDNRYGLINVEYAALPLDYEINEEMEGPKEDYAVLVLSNCRIELVKPLIGSILYLFDHLKQHSFFSEVQRWYWSLRHMILHMMSLDELEIIRYNSMLYHFFYAFTQLLKYEIIEGIDTKRKVEIYGDKGWQTVFPEYWQNKYLNSEEMEAVFSQRQHVYLMMNFSITYFDSAGATFDCISRKVPFINYPPLARTQPFEGLKCIEYNNMAELNYLIENIRAVVENEGYKKSIRASKDALTTATRKIEEQIVYGKKFYEEDVFSRQRKEHKRLLEKIAQEYIDENEAFLRETFRILLLGEPFQYDASKSKYFNRKYVQRILQSIQKEQSMPE